PAAQKAQRYSGRFTVLSVELASSTPPQLGHRMFQDRSKSPVRAACRNPAITRSSSSFPWRAKSSALIRLSARSGASRTSRSIAPATSGSAAWRRAENRDSDSLMVQKVGCPSSMEKGARAYPASRLAPSVKRRDSIRVARPHGSPTMTAIPDKFLDLVTKKKAFANLATVMPDGSPQVTPVWIDYADGLIKV